MNCSHAQDAIQLDLDGELSPPQTQELAEHLSRCSDCRNILRQHQAIRGAMFRLAAGSVEIAEPVLVPGSSTGAGAVGDMSLPAHRRRSWRPLLAVAAAVVLCFCGWRVVSQMHGWSKGQPDLVAGSGGSQSAPAGRELAASQKASQVADAHSDPRSAVRVEFDRSSDVIALPKPTRNPNITVLWIYPAVRTAEAPPRSSIESDPNHEGVQS